MNLDARIYVAGHKGLVGSAIMRELTAQGYTNLVTRSRAVADLRSRRDTSRVFQDERPEYVFLAAAVVGGIGANLARPGEFIRDNLSVQCNVIEAARTHGVKRLLFLGSSCIYPRDCPQPIREEALLTGPLEPTNQAYAVAKIAGIEMLRAYRAQFGFQSIAVMPTNLYGPGDRYDDGGHVLPMLIRKFHEAKVRGSNQVELWGTGRPRREFLHVDDCAKACVRLMQAESPPEIINVGAGEDMTIAELATLVGDVVGFTGSRLWDPAKPDGMPRKLLDIARIKAMGWRPAISLRDGIAATYADWCPPIRVAPTGYWIDARPAHHMTSPALGRWMVEYLGGIGGPVLERLRADTKQVYDFGCGLGHYIRQLSEAKWMCLGFEAEPANRAAFANIRAQNVAMPMPGTWPPGHVLSIEVGEHIPAEHEDTYLANLALFVRPGGALILSWAVRGQGGDGHVNCLDNWEVVAKLAPYGFALQEGPTAEARAAAELPWLKNTLMVFRKAAE